MLSSSSAHALAHKIPTQNRIVSERARPHLAIVAMTESFIIDTRAQTSPPQSRAQTSADTVFLNCFHYKHKTQLTYTHTKLGQNKQLCSGSAAMPPHHRCLHTLRPSVYAFTLRVFSHFSLAMRHVLSCVVLSSSEATFARRLRISCNDDDDALLCIYPPVFCFIHKRPHQASAIRSITPSPLGYLYTTGNALAGLTLDRGKAVVAANGGDFEWRETRERGWRSGVWGSSRRQHHLCECCRTSAASIVQGARDARGARCRPEVRPLSLIIFITWQ